MPAWVTGFCDRSGSFGLTLYQQGVKWRVKAVFEILCDVRDVEVLKSIQQFLGVGKIYSTNNTATLRVTRIAELMTLIAHFNAYPLLSPKMVVYALWSEAVTMINASLHLTDEGFKRIIALSSALGRGLSANAIQEFGIVTPIAMPEYTPSVDANSIDRWWISGFFTLYCNFSLKLDSGYWNNAPYNKFRHVFSVSFDASLGVLAKIIADALDVSCYVRKDGRVDIMAQGLEEALRISLFFKSYPLQSYKQEQFDVWYKAVLLSQEHHSLDSQRRFPELTPGRLNSFLLNCRRLERLQR